MVSFGRDLKKNGKSNDNIIRVTFTDSIPVELSGRVQILETGDLLISNVRETDAGSYTCIRSNEAGSVTGKAYLGVMGRFSLKFDLSRMKYDIPHSYF